MTRLFNKSHSIIDDPAEIEAVVSIYYRAMEQIKYRTYPETETGQEDPRNIPYMVQ